MLGTVGNVVLVSKASLHCSSVVIMDRGHEGNFLGMEFCPPDISTRNAEARLVGVA